MSNEKCDAMVLKRSDVLNLNSIVNDSFLGDGSKESNKEIMKFKRELANEASKVEEFQKATVESVKTERFKELLDKKQKEELKGKEIKEFETINSEVEKKLNDILGEYFLEDVELVYNKISEDDFYEFVVANKSKFQLVKVDYLYKFLVK